MKILLQIPIRKLPKKTSLYVTWRDPSLKNTPGIFITEHFKKL